MIDKTALDRLDYLSDVGKFTVEKIYESHHYKDEDVTEFSHYEIRNPNYPTFYACVNEKEVEYIASINGHEDRIDPKRLLQLIEFCVKMGADTESYIPWGDE